MPGGSLTGGVSKTKKAAGMRPGTETDAMWLLKQKSLVELLQLPISSWWGMLAAAVCLIVVIWTIIRLVARVNEGTDPAEADREMLMTMTELHRQGDLSKDEFRSIKSQLVERISDVDGIAAKREKPAETAANRNPELSGTGDETTGDETDPEDGEETRRVLPEDET